MDFEQQKKADEAELIRLSKEKEKLLTELTELRSRKEGMQYVKLETWENDIKQREAALKIKEHALDEREKNIEKTLAQAREQIALWRANK